MGVGGEQVHVNKVVKHAPQERDIVRISTAFGALAVTADHAILVEGPAGEPERATIGTVQVGNTKVFDGKRFHPVIDVHPYSAPVQAIEVTFDDDGAAVLAWTFPGRAPRSVLSTAAVACLGRMHDATDCLNLAGFEVSRTFLSERRATAAGAEPRSRSLGARPDTRSHWSVGSVRHSSLQPEHCQICEAHHYHLQRPDSSACPWNRMPTVPCSTPGAPLASFGEGSVS